MLSLEFVSAILQASITGAGLVIAIYALISPISSRIFRDRIELYHKKKKEFDKLKERITPESSHKDVGQLENLAMEIQGIKIFPRYLGPYVLAVFTCYIISALFATAWLTNPLEENIVGDYALLFFVGSTFGFLAVGYSTIIDVYRAMKGEYEQLKKKQEEVERIKEELQKLKSKRWIS